jgi:enoyl-CoA hydratase/carnithine racemase
MSYEFYLVEKKPPIAWVYLNRPDKKNAMNPPSWKESISIFNDLDADDDIRVIILAAKGDTFSAGLDLVSSMKEFPEFMDPHQKGGVKRSIIKKILAFQDGISIIEECRKPVIAAVNGYCVGLGLDMIAACDIRLSTKDAIFSLREAAMAIVADIGVLQRLPHIIGQGLTRELAYTAKNIDAKRAKDIHLVNEIYKDKDELLVEAEKMAMEIAGNSPIAVQGTKDVLNFGIGKSISDGLKYVAAINTNYMTSNDLTEAFTAFAQKRKPEFKGD